MENVYFSHVIVKKISHLNSRAFTRVEQHDVCHALTWLTREKRV